VRFGVFEADFAAGELRRQGIKIKLQEQPLQILEVLLERPGEIVSRDELQKRVWPADTFVDFDHGLYSAINRLREALGDSSGTPRYIETVARRGYRFVAPIDRHATTTDRATVKRGLVVPPPSLPQRPLRRSVFGLIAGLLGGTALLAFFSASTSAGQGNGCGDTADRQFGLWQSCRWRIFPGIRSRTTSQMG